MNGMTKVISMRTFASFAECLKDAEDNGFQQGENRSEFERCVGTGSIVSVANARQPPAS
ncbi:MAG TPA: hypothetical protein VLN59_07725 [Burkholderiales bacterium]|nr:hypothetical protein [Burkholderiales bacterium]